jgi:hypothetical protein
MMIWWNGSCRVAEAGGSTEGLCRILKDWTSVESDLAVIDWLQEEMVDEMQVDDCHVGIEVEKNSSMQYSGVYIL